MNNWKAQDTTHCWPQAEGEEPTSALHLGGLEIIDEDEVPVAYFELLQTPTHIVFGNPSNAVFLESGNFLIDTEFSIDENLRECIADLECYYLDGVGYQTEAFSCNKRM